MDTEKKFIKSPHGEPKQMTFEEWLQSAGGLLPEGFREWSLAHFFWDEGEEIGWAIFQFDKHQKIQGKKPNKVTIK